MVVMANTFVKDNKSRLFPNTFKRTPKSPDYSGLLQMSGVVYYVALWKRASRTNGKEFLRGLLHKDGERGRNCGSLNLYNNRWYNGENKEIKLPIFYGRLTMGNKNYKVQYWINTSKQGKEYYGGAIRDLVTS